MKKGKVMNDESGKDGVDRLVDAYERMLQFVHDGVERLGSETWPALGDRLGGAREKMVELGELSREEADKVSGYLERDMEDAARYIADTGEEFSQWLRTDISLIEARVLEMFAQVADQTSLQLNQLAEQARRMPYKTGEVSGPGVLVCRGCGEEIHFHKAGRIPPCPKCRGSEFERKA
jgi:polyhydroxyalkanoate synthesis regulator phasin